MCSAALYVCGEEQWEMLPRSVGDVVTFTVFIALKNDRRQFTWEEVYL